MIVAGEILVLPLVFGEILVAVVFSIANAAMLVWRIRAEEAALAGRPEPG
jgi:methyltransferase